jgi:hypothetical protein
VRVEPSQDKGTLLTFSDGRQVFGAVYLATATNVDSGKTIRLNLSGQFMFDPATGVFSTTGTTVLADQGALLLVHGPIIFDAQGRTIIGSSVTDLCAVLQRSVALGNGIESGATSPSCLVRTCSSRKPSLNSFEKSDDSCESAPKAASANGRRRAAGRGRPLRRRRRERAINRRALR